MNEPANLPPLPGGQPPASFVARLLPCFLTFTSSFCVMVIELVAGRLISRHVGNSLYTWTSVIGVVLGGITLGNWLGGLLADMFKPRKTLSVLFLLAALTTLGIPLLDHMAGGRGNESLFKISEIQNWPLRIALHVCAVFLLPATVLGLIGPNVAKMALDHGRKAGSTVGNVYAWGALGSIVGTFLTGFYLVQAMGTVGIVYSVAGLLAFVGLGLAPSLIWPGFTAACLFFAIQAWQGPWEWKVGGGQFLVQKKPDSDCVYTTETQYSYIRIDQEGADDGEKRTLILDNLIHAYYTPSDVTELQYEYEKIYAGVIHRFGKDRSGLHALFFGGGGYIFPRYIREKWPQSSIEVAEIDPGVTQADIEGFGVSPDEIRIVGNESPVKKDPESLPSLDLREPIEVHHMDARNRVDELVEAKRTDKSFEPFDFIFGDAFNYYAVPSHLVTKEFNEKVKELLRPEDGIYMINVIDIYYWGGFLGGVCNTMREVFPYVYVFSNTEGHPDIDVTGRDTFIVIGSLKDLGDLSDLGSREGEMKFTGSLLNERHLKTLAKRSNGIVLTDDYAPVENLLEVVVRMKDSSDDKDGKSEDKYEKRGEYDE